MKMAELHPLKVFPFTINVCIASAFGVFFDC